MAVALDTLSSPPAGNSPGPHGHMGVSTLGTSLNTIPTFQNIGASATFLIVAVIGQVVAGSTGTRTLTWDSGGTNQTMTKVTSSLVFMGTGTDVGSVEMHGLVLPTAGNNAIGIVSTNNAEGNCYLVGMSFTGTLTSSVAAVVEGVATNNTGGVNSSQGTVTTATSIPNGDMIFSAFCDTANNWVDPKAPTTDGSTEIDINGSLATGGGAAYYSGAGATKTALWNTNAGTNDDWCAAIVGISGPPPGTGVPHSYYSNQPYLSSIQAQRRMSIGWRPFVDPSKARPRRRGLLVRDCNLVLPSRKIVRAA